MADSQVCHGKLTFRATRASVSEGLDRVASGMSWDAIIEERHGSIGRDAIAEAVRFAKDALIKQTHALATGSFPLSSGKRNNDE